MEKKTLFDISWKVSEDEYRNDSAYSYSTISRFNREGFDNLDKLFDAVGQKLKFIQVASENNEKKEEKNEENKNKDEKKDENSKKND